MKMRTFWHLALKTLGMWLIINSIISLPVTIHSVLAVLTDSFSWRYVIVETAYLTSLLVFYFLILQFLILKSQRTVDFLKLEKGFEEIRINFTISYDKLLKIVIILIGGILFLKAVPKLVESLYLFDQGSKTIDIVIYSSQAFISFLIMTNSNFVRRYISKESLKVN
ncbi:hypothetical protein [Fluviicola chungangensis]|uniref:Uncharacterized protein n=1 Tax=Fluviicola chungangensis TaxID=2597671 RepID=A0A556N7G9_9FLAO|nr:hypothetical protein [Fluviicola chungangensis]TSJ48023.1 hypothetical protein FO442_02515 [Fluviicola chungangensis]